MRSSHATTIASEVKQTRDAEAVGPQSACLNFLYFIKGGPCGAACLLYASPAAPAAPLSASPVQPTAGRACGLAAGP
ncbi:hypothetical protein ABT324_24520, partial [Saccharopolyspora sp. NPDC000359]|uniref:hypothetical protein n=1 Tax=Saccharopolyspora sp. NPDC000359 TaxID=3154251 RepID=UPI0033215C62